MMLSGDEAFGDDVTSGPSEDDPFPIPRRRRAALPRRRGDLIPPVSDYAHWNEDAEAMWYAENKYDMEHADEIVEEDEDDRSFDPDDE